MNRYTFRVTSLLALIILVSCNTSTQGLPIATIQPPTAGATSVPPTPASSPTITATLTPAPTLPPPSISADNLNQIQFLHEYWHSIAAAARPYAGMEWDSLPTWVASATAYSPDGRFIAIGGCTVGGFHGGESGRLWCGYSAAERGSNTEKPLGFVVDAHTEEVIATLPEYGQDATITDLDFTHDGRKLLIATVQLDASLPAKLEVWDVASQEVEKVLWEATGYPRIAISPDDQWVAINDFEALLALDLSSGEIIAEKPEDYGVLGPSPQISADGAKVATIDADRFRVFDTTTWEEAAYFEFPEYRFYAVFSPDLSLTATTENTIDPAPILIWDVATGQQIQSLPASQADIIQMTFTPDGRLLVVVTADNIASIWATDDWKLAGDYTLADFAPVGFSGYYVLFSADGRTFLYPTVVGIYLDGLP